MLEQQPAAERKLTVDILVKQSQEKFYQVDPTVAAILISAGLVEKLKPAPAPSPFPPAGWGVPTMVRGNPLPHPHIFKTDGFGGTCYWDAPPADCPESEEQQWEALVGRLQAREGKNEPDKVMGLVTHDRLSAECRMLVAER